MTGKCRSSRLQRQSVCSANSLLPFIDENIKAGSAVFTDGWKGYESLDENTYHILHKVFQNKAIDKDSVLPGVHLVASLVKRVILGTYQGRFDPKYLQNYLDEYVFRFNRRNSKFIGKKFMRIVQQTIGSAKITWYQIKKNSSLNISPETSLGLSV